MAVFATLAIFVSNARAQCLFNATHCQCLISTENSMCSRHQSGRGENAICIADHCDDISYRCDCKGNFICPLKKCTPQWQPVGPSPITIGDVYQCEKRFYNFIPSSSPYGANDLINDDNHSKAQCIDNSGVEQLPYPSQIPTRSPSASFSITSTSTISIAPSSTMSKIPTTSMTPSPSSTVSSSYSGSYSPSPSSTKSASPSVSISPSPSISVSSTSTSKSTPSASNSNTPSVSVSSTPSPSLSTTPSSSWSPFPSSSLSMIPSTSHSQSPSVSASPIPSVSDSNIPSSSLVLPSPKTSPILNLDLFPGMEGDEEEDGSSSLELISRLCNSIKGVCCDKSCAICAKENCALDKDGFFSLSTAKKCCSNYIYPLNNNCAIDEPPCVLPSFTPALSPTPALGPICNEAKGICCNRGCPACGEIGCGNNVFGQPDQTIAENCCSENINAQKRICNSLFSELPCILSAKDNSPNPTPTPTPTPSFGQLCNEGSGVCCHSSCAVCAAKNCGNDEFGKYQDINADNCCSEHIIPSGRICGLNDPPCMIPVTGTQFQLEVPL